ncbi:MAG: alkaline phosphatase family protein [Candidatus Sulfotelmatobacter sp.]
MLVLAASGLAGAQNSKALPQPSHVVVVVEENHAYDDVIGSADAPYINQLAAEGASFTQSYAVTHPSEPNYLALFSGSTQGVKGNPCRSMFSAPNLGSELIAAGKTFTGFSEGLPAVGSQICTSGKYARKHVPWVDFSNMPPDDNQPFTSFPTDFAKLPTVAWVIPNLDNDMHDGSVARGDAWLKKNLADYLAWAQKNNSLLIVTWDEDEDTDVNRIATIFVGPMVKPGKYSEKIDHYSVLRTLEAMYGLPYEGKSSSAKTIVDVWR